MIAAVGIRGEITILEVGLPARLAMALTKAGGGLDLGVDMSVGVSFETLSGVIGVFAKIGICPISCVVAVLFLKANAAVREATRSPVTVLSAPMIIIGVVLLAMAYSGKPTESTA